MSLSILLIPFAFFVIIWMLFSLMIMGNLLKYVKEMPAAGLLLLIYAFGSIIIIAVSWFFLTLIEWGTPLTLF